MQRNRRPQPPTTLFTGREFSRFSAAILMLFILAMIIASASRPSTWTWLTGDDEKKVVAAEKGAGNAQQPAWQETIVPGPTGTDDREEQEALSEELEAASDKSALAAEEMPSYWRLLRWARARPWADLKARSRRDVLYTQLWERPEKYRGELISLRLHLVRALEHEAPENIAGFKQVCEVWGWTDESQSFPYVAVLVERPPQLKLGAKIDQEANFVGYFLKTMAYTDALGERRASPLLLGRLQCHERAASAMSQPQDASAFWQTLAAGAALLLIAGSWYWRRRSRRWPLASDAGKNAETEVWLQAVQAEGTSLPLQQGNGHAKEQSRFSVLFDRQEHEEDA